MNRLRTTIIACLCLVSIGCVENETICTVNPDGSAKVQIDLVCGMPTNIFEFQAGKKSEEKSLDYFIRRSIRPTLEAPGIVAWKDVAAEFLPDGKLKFSGTAYVKRLEDFNPNRGLQISIVELSASRNASGALILKSVKHNDNAADMISPGNRPLKTPDEIKKMTDEELDKYILRELIELQANKPRLIESLTDNKAKTTYILPGEVTATMGFVKDGTKAIFAMDGNKMLDKLNKFLAQNPAAWRKFYRNATTTKLPDSLLFGADDPDDLSITIAKPGKALFDFDKEVKEAQSAYPQLRKKLGFGDDLRLPTGNAPPKK